MFNNFFWTIWTLNFYMCTLLMFLKQISRCEALFTLWRRIKLRYTYKFDTVSINDERKQIKYEIIICINNEGFEQANEVLKWINISPGYVCIWMEVQSALIFDVYWADFPSESIPNICCICGKKSFDSKRPNFIKQLIFNTGSIWIWVMCV